MSLAVISLGGKQFTVEPGKIIDVPRMSHEAGKSFESADLLAGKTVKATVLEHNRDDKVRVVKFKNKTRYTRTIGHRTNLTKVKIDSIA